MKQKAFTLIELLVVIAVIAVLMAILMPVLKRAREQGKRVACLSNLRQLMLAWSLYADEYDERIVNGLARMDSSKEGARPWVYRRETSKTQDEKLQDLRAGALFNFASEEGLYKCPTGIRGEVVTYAIVDAMNGYPHDLMGRPTWKILRKRTEIRRPGERLVFLDEGRLTPGSWSIYFDQPQWYDLVPVRHGVGTTLGFADGHGGYVKWTDPRTIEYGKAFEFVSGSPLNPNQPGNPDLEYMQRICWGDLGYKP